MTTLTKELLLAIQADMKAAMLEVGKKHGVAIVSGGSRYDATIANCKYTIVPESEDGTKVKSATELKWSRELETHKRWNPTLNFDKSITVRGKLYTIVGYRPRAKAPYVGQDTVGKQYALGAEEVESQLK